ncbi:late embryogenesis abundant (LEA) hydroxyproline-rich glycoprotein family [Actinidia rufa]|uniref:Late embryogenesis abundant (LEA) hydroxyproline-rich glycoprotein family n=1 Tax=Actinidia rufa TaxID=165716 RepID=A0A7J0DN35_9ERIC|nr:late embryogenesis abundant (LEA) hydroxyproline-rich glycoprotein family [Actinidia rufa]
MADRVHPRDSPPSSGEAPMAKPSQSVPVQPAGTYVIQIPKDQIYRYPPPENARRYQKYSRREPRRRCCRRCLCWSLSLLASLLLLLAVAAGVLYLVFRPESPKYSIDDVSIHGFNLTSPSAVSPEFNVTIRAQNPNDKIGIYYQKESSVTVYYSGINLCNGVLPVFYQPSNNLTVFQTALKGSKILLTNAVHSTLAAEEKRGELPFRLNLKAPVKFKVGAVKTWTITFKVKCELTVDSLTSSAKIVTTDCDSRVKLW